jgi:hypothetical protein
MHSANYRLIKQVAFSGNPQNTNGLFFSLFDFLDTLSNIRDHAGIPEDQLDTLY